MAAYQMGVKFVHGSANTVITTYVAALRRHQVLPRRWNQQGQGCPETLVRPELPPYRFRPVGRLGLPNLRGPWGPSGPSGPSRQNRLHEMK
jgi:hypothetical protein